MPSYFLVRIDQHPTMDNTPLYYKYAGWTPDRGKASPLPDQTETTRVLRLIRKPEGTTVQVTVITVTETEQQHTLA